MVIKIHLKPQHQNSGVYMRIFFTFLNLFYLMETFSLRYNGSILDVTLRINSLSVSFCNFVSRGGRCAGPGAKEVQQCKGRVEEWEGVSCGSLPGSSCEVLLGEEFFLFSRRKERESAYFYRACFVDSFFLLLFVCKINIILIRCTFTFSAWK